MKVDRALGVPDPTPSPEELLVAVGRGDAAAFDALYPRIAGPVHGLAVRVVRDPDLAQDVSQEALVEVWRQAPRFDPDRGSAMAWILTIAHRRAVDRVRREETQSGVREKAAAVHDVPQPDEVPLAAHRSLEGARVRRALAGLSAVQREAIEMAYWRGYTHQEVSAALAVPLGTAKTRIRDGLIRLRDALHVEEVDR
ncbi:sigma-70 family RNA polymerase sigma factor [Actinotalea sp. M2MS4P-6]|uniref:sigma-70 family RNA polymerase sigma factor n=1 Tax=Actinotalea sp. M2MS4P-6 TaxID=2983762 RepID=UPI0021E4C9FC|nr:sigma-70 family RNA polymerase sigma factor [Actinotalea sp. M2MS4P-6]MCV2396063.1 sigma-70 family RNA polymerase sigma factor [Actinotalea sp. M2MS4P-6]